MVVWRALLCLLLASACGGASTARGGSPPEELRVSAAASLSDAFADIAVAFERRHPGVEVVLNLAGSSTLREQILAGAPADVFVSADVDNAQRIVDAGAARGEPTVLARNQLAIAVPAGNPGQVRGLEDLADPSRFVGVCAPQVPCGELARRVLRAAGVEPSIDTEEPDVRSLLSKIRSGELDVGLVYRSDVQAGRGEVETIALPPGVSGSATYAVVVLGDAPNRAGADAFVAFVRSDAGRALLRAHGFDAP